ncbi:MAG: GNAT family N-acetyltransferase [Oscillospiraceae bacterium]
MKIDYSKYYWQNEKVRLRKATVDDWDAFYTNYFDNTARFFLDSEIELPMNQDDAKERWRVFLEQTAEGFVFTIENLNGEKVGSANFNAVDERNGTFDLGMIIDGSCRGKGYGTAALRIILDYAFNERRLHKYSSFVIDGNIASETMLKNIGCIHEGVVRETIFHQGRYWNTIHYGITADEFNAKWKPNR